MPLPNDIDLATCQPAVVSRSGAVDIYKTYSIGPSGLVATGDFGDEPKNPNEPITCLPGYHYDAAKDRCVKDVGTCPTGQHWDYDAEGCVPDVVVSTSTFTITAAEITEMGKRLKGTSVASSNLHVQRTVTRCKEKANYFIANHTSCRWGGPLLFNTTSYNPDAQPLGSVMKAARGEITDKNEPRVGDNLSDPPHEASLEAVKAAFRYLCDTDLTTGERADYFNKLRLHLLYYTTLSTVDFGNRTYYPVGHFDDVNPSFFIMSWVYTLWRIYDYTRKGFDTISTGADDKKKIETWFFNAVDYLHSAGNNGFNSLYSSQGGWTFRESGGSLTYTYTSTSFRGYTHYGGYPIPGNTQYYNNRRLLLVYLGGAMAEYWHQRGTASIDLASTRKYNAVNTPYTAAELTTRIARICKEAEVTYKEDITHATFPDGNKAEWTRGGPGNPEQGTNYVGCVVHSEATYLDQMCRIGRTDLLDFASSGGIKLNAPKLVAGVQQKDSSGNTIYEVQNATLGGPKKFLNIARNWVKYWARDQGADKFVPGRFVTDTKHASTWNNNNTYRIDGQTDGGIRYILDIGVAPVMHKLNDALIFSIVYRTYAGTFLPDSPSSIGQQSGYDGAFAQAPEGMALRYFYLKEAGCEPY